MKRNVFSCLLKEAREVAVVTYARDILSTGKQDCQLSKLLKESKEYSCRSRDLILHSHTVWCYCSKQWYGATVAQYQCQVLVMSCCMVRTAGVSAGSGKSSRARCFTTRQHWAWSQCPQSASAALQHLGARPGTWRRPRKQASWSTGTGNTVLFFCVWAVVLTVLYRIQGCVTSD